MQTFFEKNCNFLKKIVNLQKTLFKYISILRYEKISVHFFVCLAWCAQLL